MIYEFSDLKFDLDRHLLTRGEQPIKLTRLSFRVLRALVEAAPALVSHDDLISRVWGPKRVITPENLSQRLTTLRKSLGDDPNNPIYIEGVRGAGYRLVPDVRVQSSSESGQTSRRNWPFALALILAGLLAWALADRITLTGSEPAVSSDSATLTESPTLDQAQAPALAILPFANLSADPSNQYFADGIHDDLLSRVSKIQDIKTISRTSVMTYKGSDKKLRDIAQELGVNTILEGGVQRSGEQVRINLQLIDAGTDAHLWAQTYTRKLTATNVFAVQAEITEAVAGALRAVLSEDEQNQVESRPTNNLQALDAYFLGNHYYSQATSEGYAKAIVAYQTAIKFDPEFSLAYSKQALTLLKQTWNSGMPIKTQLEKSRPLVEQAILLDPQSSEAFTALGTWYANAGNIAEAEQAYVRAMALGPNNAIALVDYGNLMQWQRADTASAIDLYRRAIELDPQNISIKVELASTMKYVGQADEGIQIMEDVIERQPDSSAGYRILAELYSDGKFRHDKGIRAMRRAFELDPSHPMNSFHNAFMHWKLGDNDNTALWMNHIAGLAPDPEEARVYRGWAFIAQRNFESAREEFYRSRSRSEFYWFGVFNLGSLDTKEGRPDDAIKRFQDYAAAFNGRKTSLNIYFALVSIEAYQAMGEQETAQALLDELISILEANPSVNFPDSAIQEASVYALSGQVEVAIATLEDWVNRGGATSVLQLYTTHGLGVLEDDPRYQSIQRTVNDRLSEQMTNISDWEASGEMPPIPIPQS